MASRSWPSEMEISEIRKLPVTSLEKILPASSVLLSLPVLLDGFLSPKYSSFLKKSGSFHSELPDFTLFPGSVNLPVDRLDPVLFKKCIRLTEWSASKESSVRRQRTRMRCLQYEMLLIVQHPLLPLCRCSP